jgi:hypothetical protein
LGGHMLGIVAGLGFRGRDSAEAVHEALGRTCGLPRSWPRSDCCW